EAQAQEAQARAGLVTVRADAAAPVPPQPPAQTGSRVLSVMSTGYALPGTTATGLPVGPGIVAVDPTVIPLGTRMTIPGYGEGVAADTGSAVTGADIDVAVATEAEASAWGRGAITIELHEAETQLAQGP